MRFGILTAALAGVMAWTLGASSALARCQVSIIATLPVTMNGLRPLVPAKINGKEVMFLLDSGAFYSSINTAVATELQLSKQYLPTFFRLEGVAGSADATMTTVKDFELAGIPLKRMQFLVTSASETGGVGLLGQNVLGFADVEYDLPHGVVRLLKSSGCDGVSLAYWAKDKAYSVIGIERLDDGNRHTIGDIQLNGHTLRATFDTGAYTTVVSRHGAAVAGVKVDDPGVESGDITGGIGGATMKSWRGKFGSFKLGDEEVRNIKLSISERLGSSDMLVGADFFISHRILVSNRTRRLYVSYEGGPVFSTEAEARERSADGKTERKVEATLTAEAEPADADGYARRGMAALSRQQPDQALADLDKAVAMAPREPRYLVDRARIKVTARKMYLAMTDLDAALKLKPDFAEALIARASFKLGGHDPVAALADLDAASKALPKEAEARIGLGELYERAGQPEQSLAQMNQWLSTHPDDAQAMHALNGRCFARGLLGIELEQAAKDCDRAIWLAPRTAPPLDSRGLVNLRRQKWQAAVDDYSAALAINPKIAWSLYGRGVARKHLGQGIDGDADIKAALALEPELAEQVKRYRINAEAPPPSP